MLKQHGLVPPKTMSIRERVVQLIGMIIRTHRQSGMAIRSEDTVTGREDLEDMPELRFVRDANRTDAMDDGQQAHTYKQPVGPAHWTI